MWLSRLNSLVKFTRRSRVHEVNHPGGGDPSCAYAFVNQLMTGMALLKAQHVGAEVIPIVVSDASVGQLGGTNDFLKFLSPEVRGKTINLYRNSVMEKGGAGK